METFNHHDVVNTEGNRPEMSFNGLFSHTIENYKKSFGWIVLFFVLILVLNSAFSWISQLISGYDSMEAGKILQRKAMTNTSPFLMLLNVPNFIPYTIINWVLNVLIFPLLVAFPYILHKTNTGKEILLEDLIIGYKKNAIGFIILSILVNILSAVPIFMCVFPVFFVIPFLFTSFCFMLFEDASPIKALKGSFKLGQENYGTILGFSFVAFLISLSGFLACCIGLIATLPFFYASGYSAYCAAKGVPNE